MVVLGFIAMRRNKTVKDYFVTDKGLGVYSIAVLWMTTWIGGGAIVGTSTDSYNAGISGGWFVITIFIGVILFGVIFSGRIKSLGNRFNNITYCALMENRFDDRTSFLVVVCSFITFLGATASQLVALGTMLSTMTGWSQGAAFVVGCLVTIIYSAIGGLLAINYTAHVQFILIMLGTVVLGIPFAANAVGSVGGLASLPEEYFVLNRAGIGTMLALAVSTIGSIVTGMDSFQRCFAAKDEKSARRGTYIASAVVLAVAIGATFIGMAAKVLYPEIPTGNSPYAYLVMNVFPVGLSGLVLVGVLAAVMSSGVGCINVCAANVSVDMYYDRLSKNPKDSTAKTIAIISSIVCGAVAALLAWWKYNIIEIILLAYSFQTAMLLIPTVAGMFWKKPTSAAAFWSMIASMLVVFLWLIGDAAGWGPIFSIDALWPGLIASAAVFFPITILGKPTEEDIAKAEAFCA